DDGLLSEHPRERRVFPTAAGLAAGGAPQGVRRGLRIARRVPPGEVVLDLCAGAVPDLRDRRRLPCDRRRRGAQDPRHGALDPVPRRRVLLDKAFAMLAATVGLGVVLALAIAVSGPPFEIAVSTANIAAAVGGCGLLSIA